MNTIYALQPLHPSIFLAGPTPRSKAVHSWRPEALEELRRQGFDGSVLVPEPEPGAEWHWTLQVAWESAALQSASCIMFWIPRVMETMPAMTTNVEFGWWYRSGKIVVGMPATAERVRYIEWQCQTLGIPVARSLAETVRNAIRMAKKIS